VLLDADSPYHAAPVAIILVGVARVLPQLLVLLAPEEVAAEIAVELRKHR